MRGKRKKLRFPLVKFFEARVYFFQIHRQSFYFLPPLHLLPHAPHKKDAEKKHGGEERGIQKKLIASEGKRQTERHEKPEKKHESLRGDYADVKKTKPQDGVADDYR